eukprot:2055979-Pyramimonas_sp.AAC.2
MDTVGDAYIVVQLMPRAASANLRRMAVQNMFKVALALSQIVQRKSAKGEHGLEKGQLQIRLGMCIGSVIAGVVSALKVTENEKIMRDLFSVTRPFLNWKELLYVLQELTGRLYLRPLTYEPKIMLTNPPA